MHVFSLSFITFLAIWSSGLINPPDFGYNAKTVMPITKAKKIRVIESSPLGKPLGLVFDSYGGAVYHNYGNYTLDVSGKTPNSNVTFYWNVYTIPNRFTLANGTNTVTTNWRGKANSAGPWRPDPLMTPNSGTIQINIGTASTITLTVESLNTNPASGDDTWDISY